MAASWKTTILTMGELPRAVASLIGVESDRVESAAEMYKAMIVHQCKMLEDANPLYTCEDYGECSKPLGYARAVKIARASGVPYCSVVGPLKKHKHSRR